MTLNIRNVDEKLTLQKTMITTRHYSQKAFAEKNRVIILTSYSKKQKCLPMFEETKKARVTISCSLTPKWLK